MNNMDKETNPYYDEVKSSIAPKPKKGIEKTPVKDKISKDTLVIQEVEDIDIVDEPSLTDAELIENILKVSQKDVEFINNGKRFETIGNFEEALKCYDQAIQVNPKNIDAWVNKRNALDELGEHEKANECKNKIYELRKEG